ncbi:mCG146300, isoform CRA_a, partial [Mus musculus]
GPESTVTSHTAGREVAQAGDGGEGTIPSRFINSCPLGEWQKGSWQVLKPTSFCRPRDILPKALQYSSLDRGSKMADEKSPRRWGSPGVHSSSWLWRGHRWIELRWCQAPEALMPNLACSGC